MRHALNLFVSALLLGTFLTPLFAQEIPSPPYVPDQDRIDMVRLVCPWTIYVTMAVFQKHSHQEDAEFGEALTVSIRRMEDFMIAHKWSDRETIERAKKGMEDFLIRLYVDHPIKTKDEPSDDLCKLENYEEAYQKVRVQPLDEIREWAARDLVLPLSKKSLGGTACQ